MNYLKEVEGIVGSGLFRKIQNKYFVEMENFPAAIKHHHAEKGGYIRHIYEVINFCLELSRLANLSFDVDVLLRIAFIHDLDKLERYEIDNEAPTAAQVKYAINLGVSRTAEDSKSSISTKIDNKKNGLNNPIQYYRYRELLVIDESAKVTQMCGKLGIELTDEDIHCLSTHHGGWSDAGKRGSLSPMATILHCADLMSARILG